jgi:hypothetical protein
MKGDGEDSLDDWMSPEKRALYKEEFDYEITPDGVRINVMKIFKLLFSSANMNKSSLFLMIDLFMPIFR